MGYDYGRSVIGNTGIPIYVAIDRPLFRPAGVTIDWSKFAAVNADTVSPEGFTVKNGQKWARFGQVITRITNQPVQTTTVNGTPTGGTFTLSLTRPDTGGYVTTAPIAFGATAAAVQAAIQAVIGPYPVAVTGSAGGPFTVTGPVPIVASDGSLLAGGTTPSVTTVVTTANGNYGQFGPYDPAANDGRQTLTQGECAVLNTSVVESGIFGIARLATTHPGVLVGGLVWKARLIATAGTHSLAAGPTYAELLAAMPMLEYGGINP